METMLAAVIHEHGERDVVRPGTIPYPETGAARGKN